MPWPRLGTFGLVDNPLIDSPFNEGSNLDFTPPTPPSGDLFLLLTGSDFLLLTGDKFLLLS
jgi:hypothetical protein